MKEDEIHRAAARAGLKIVKRKKDEPPAVFSFQKDKDWFRCGKNTAAFVLVFESNSKGSTTTPPKLEIRRVGNTENCGEPELLPGGPIVVWEHHEFVAPDGLRIAVNRFLTRPT
jgi:hypothetical protein